MRQYKRATIWITRFPERDNGTKKVFKEIMAENFQNLMKYINLQIQEAEWTPDNIKPKNFIPRHNNKMENLVPNMSKVTLNINGLNIWIKNRD